MVTPLKRYKSGTFFKDEFRGDSSWNGNEYNNLLRDEGTDADGNLKFADVAMAMGADVQADSRGMAVADFDNDGDLDIVIATNKGDCGKDWVAPVLLRNDVGDQRHWFSLSLQGGTKNRDALGAEVRIEVAASGNQGALKLMRHVTCGSGYASQNDRRLLFGLGDSKSISKLTIRWPDGEQEVIPGPIAVDQRYHLTKGQQLKKIDDPSIDHALSLERGQ